MGRLVPPHALLHSLNGSVKNILHVGNSSFSGCSLFPSYPPFTAPGEDRGGREGIGSGGGRVLLLSLPASPPSLVQGYAELRGSPAVLQLPTAEEEEEEEEDEEEEEESRLRLPSLGGSGECRGGGGVGGVPRPSAQRPRS